MEHYRNVIDIVGRKTLGITSKFIKDYKEYNIEVLLCAYSEKEMIEAEKVFKIYE